MTLVSLRPDHSFLAGMRIWPLVFMFLGAGCASAPPMIQPQVNGLVVANRLPQAIRVIENQSQAYGPNNELLFNLDRGMVYHLAGQYRESINSFEQAKTIADNLYTTSLSKSGLAWLSNDYVTPYRGEDFEQAMLHIFQALNFVALGEMDEALVEARQVDAKLTLLNSQYPPDQRNVYREDAFIRLMMGIIYEVSGTPDDLNDALISYQKALAIYQQDYGANYETPVPVILKENLVSLAHYLGVSLDGASTQLLLNMKPLSVPERRRKAEVYVVQYNGLSPIKTQSSYPAPYDGYVTKFAFPKFRERFFEGKKFKLLARSAGLEVGQSWADLTQDIARIAQKNLENHRIRLYAKAALRPLGKFALAKSQEDQVRDGLGDQAVGWYKAATSLYNVYSEQSDLRSWQTLPAHIHVSRLVLDPGEFQLQLESYNEEDHRVESLDLGTLTLQAGDKKFMVVRTVK